MYQSSLRRHLSARPSIALTPPPGPKPPYTSIWTCNSHSKSPVYSYCSTCGGCPNLLFLLRDTSVSNRKSTWSLLGPETPFRAVLCMGGVGGGGHDGMPYGKLLALRVNCGDSRPHLCSSLRRVHVFPRESFDTSGGYTRSRKEPRFCDSRQRHCDSWESPTHSQ